MGNCNVRGEFLPGEPDVEITTIWRIRDCNVVSRRTSRELGGLGDITITRASPSSNYGLLQRPQRCASVRNGTGVDEFLHVPTCALSQRQRTHWETLTGWRSNQRIDGD